MPRQHPDDYSAIQDRSVTSLTGGTRAMSAANIDTPTVDRHQKNGRPGANVMN